MIEHVVLVRFEEQTLTEQKDEVIRRLKNLKGLIPGIMDLQVNYNFSSRSQGYEVGMTIRFESKEHLNEYGPHPEHQKVVAYMKEIGTYPALVVDFEID